RRARRCRRPAASSKDRIVATDQVRLLRRHDRDGKRHRRQDYGRIAARLPGRRLPRHTKKRSCAMSIATPPVPAGGVALNKVKWGTGRPSTMTAGAADRSLLAGGWLVRPRTSPARVVVPG